MVLSVNCAVTQSIDFPVAEHILASRCSRWYRKQISALAATPRCVFTTAFKQAARPPSLLSRSGMGKPSPRGHMRTVKSLITPVELQENKLEGKVSQKIALFNCLRIRMHSDCGQILFESDSSSNRNFRANTVLHCFCQLFKWHVAVIRLGHIIDPSGRFPSEWCVFRLSKCHVKLLPEGGFNPFWKKRIFM